MNIFERIFHKKSKKNIPPIPSWEKIVEMMYDKGLDSFTDEVVKVVYSKDCSLRYVVTKNEKGLFTYLLEAIYKFDEDEWKYIYSNDNTLPAMWEPLKCISGKSFFENIEELLKEMKEEPKYKQHF